ncbi:MAG: hypothetical protein KGH81_07255 [Thaumarchaeota archaeon]|nr:hypothetical protein [Nitrososphaerota archaeon]MDE1878793.1 hypothetical protein [Nitrososphaerota archaeon]
MPLTEESHYTISYDNPEYENSPSSLNPADKKDLAEKILILQNDPFSVATPLHKPYQGKYRVKISSGKYRLIITINLNSKNVKLWYVSGRGDAYAK